MKQFLDFLPLVVFFAFYKIYDYLFKGIAVGCKKLYQLIKGKTAAPSETSVEPPKE